ncbi:MAG: methylenetetrahydrofolate reductase [NAD(P)H] [Clostridia bacterium]|nr:methylenetetrahydrofolate reductase [NAD(P)H] [Clostridia bacterium]
MSIKDLIESKQHTFSFEVFPPKNDPSLEGIFNTIEELKELEPDFISVTYGAMGTSKDKTVEIASRIKNHYGIESIAHLTCVTSSRTELESTIGELRKANIDNILALRGDIPESFDFSNLKDNFSYASDLIRHIRRAENMTIGAACYPEKHIEAISLEQDIEHLKRKVDEGADFLITQLFFDNELFYDYYDLIQKKGINIPVIAGILPVLNKNQTSKIVELSGCKFPSKFTRILNKYHDDPVALKEAGTIYATEQITDLLSWGIKGIHLYTMNKSDTAKRIMGNIGHIRNNLKASSL